MPARIARLAILDSYGVRWTRETFARDLLQNFFDSTADFRAVAVDVRPEERVVEIRGPATFDIDLLAYIGATTKTTGRTVGGFGEGFKICALVGARDFGLTITAGSGAHEIAVFFDAVPLGRELCYRVTEREEPLAGSYVRLEGCDAESLAAFLAAPAMFRHPDNPGLQEPLVVDLEQGIGVYAAPGGKEGELYYRRQRRGAARFHGSGQSHALTLAHDGILDALEGDRDRRDLPAEPIARGIGDKLAPEDLHRVLLALMPEWRFGNDVLAGMLGAAVARNLRFGWPPRWLARSFRAPGLAQFAERQGYSIALHTFAQLGMPTPEEHYRELTTRAASPLELARFQVVADLYTELNGQEARTTALEVFDTDGAAIAGQHLGDKVIVGAQLIAGGFDASAGTILHELAHETGGEEDIRFLRRLTDLLGATLREPEKIRAARRRYAAARPSRAKPRAQPRAAKGPVQAYRPDQDGGKDDLEGVICSVLVPPGFPPTAPIFAAIRAAAQEAGVGVWVNAVYINGPIGAVTWHAPGLPTIYIGGADPEAPPEDRRAQGYRLRTYGPDGLALCPSPESLGAAIRRARDLRFFGNTGHAVNRLLCGERRERVKAILGIEIPAPKSATLTPRAQREIELRAMLAEFIKDRGGLSLEDGWAHGQEAASEAWIRETRRDRRPAQALFEEIADRLNLAIEHAGTLQSADPDYDDADTFERNAMLAALGAAVSSYALGASVAESQARAEEGFRAVRAATTRVLDLDVAVEAKGVILVHAMDCAGLGWTHGVRTRSFDVARFREAEQRGAAEARTMQRKIDDAGGFLSQHELKSKLDPFAQDPRTARIIRRNTRSWDKWARATLAVRASYDEALAASGSEIAAAARCLDEAARLLPEVVR